ncbi:MAG: radical SAM protein [Deltaproteobacteria bacterium]|nr:radical SAM protein [Deltaproteobacteria bacterium]
MSRAQVFARQARGILTRTGGYLSGYSHTLQPYSGCEFSCAYCYVRQMAVQRATPHGLPWSRWISPKLNAPQLLARAARRGALARTRIFCGSVTDPYTPIERKLRLTRGCLEVLAGATPGPDALVLQTRSPLALRDVDLLRRIPQAGLSLSIATDDDALRRRFEPNAPGIRLRIKALGALRAAGIPTQAALAPLLPCNPQRLAELLEPVADRIVVDDFHQGDGAGGRRSTAALRMLRESGHGAWAEPGYTAEALHVFRSVLGEARVVESQAGFNDTSWLAGGR